MRAARQKAGPALWFRHKRPDPEPDFEPEAPPMVMEHTSSRPPAPTERIAVDTLRDAHDRQLREEDRSMYRHSA